MAGSSKGGGIPPMVLRHGAGCRESMGELACLAAQSGGAAVRYIDDLRPPVDDGQYVTLVLSAGGVAAEVLVMTTENFYACLGKLMAAALPSLGGRALS